MLKKIVFLFAWLGIFVLSLASINYVLLPGQFIFLGSSPENIYVFQYLVSIFEVKMFVLVVAAIYIFLFLIKFFSLFERKKDDQKKTENGVLKISRSTINSYVTDLLRKDSDISGVKVNSELKGNKFLVYVKCELESTMNVIDKIAQIQEKIKTNLNEGVGVETNKIIVNISKITANEIIKETPEEQVNDTEVNN